MSDSRKEQSTTGERRAIAREAATEAAEAVLSRERERTPPAGSRDSSAEMYAIAERVVERNQPAHMMECEKGGPACELWKELEKMEAKVNEHDQIIARFDGAMRLSRWLVPMVASLASSALAVAMLRLLMGQR